MVQRPKHRRHVAQRRIERPALLDRPQRVAFEVDDPVAIGRDQDLAEVVVGVDPRQERQRRGRLEGVERLRDPRRQVAQDGRGLAGRRPPSPRPGRAGPPATHARSSARDASRGSRSGIPCAAASAPCRPAVSVPRSAATSVANSTLDLARGQDPGRQRLGDGLVGIRAVAMNAWATRHRLRPVPRRHQLREPGQRRRPRGTRPPRSGRRPAPAPG